MLLYFFFILLVLIVILKIYKPAIKGRIGEKRIAAFLSKLNPYEYKPINNVMIKTNGGTTQIDHIIVSRYGIFVIETKNYKGWIVGNEKSKYWTQVIYKRKEKLYNPIWQNYGHVKALKVNLQEYPDLVYIPIVAFSNMAELKVTTTSDVTYFKNLYNTLKKYNNEVMSFKEMEEVYSKIMSLNIVGKAEKQEHVKEIHQKIINEKATIRDNMCPRCGNELKIRKGKYGRFKGCAGYPKCRYTLKL